MFLKVLYFVVFFSYLVNLRSDAFLRNDLTDSYIQEYLDKIYLEKDLIYFEDSLSPTEKPDTSIKSSLASNMLNVHKNQILNSLGGTERLIELIKLLESDAQEEEEESIDEGIELKDYFDKIILSSNLDNNYYHYLTEIDGGKFGNFDGFGTNRLKISFSEVNKNKFSNRMNKGVKEYKFKSKLDPVIDKEHKLGEFDHKEKNRYIKEGFLAYSSGYYLVKRKNLKENEVDKYNYSIKIESPMELIDFNELVLLDEIKLLYKKKVHFKHNNGDQNTFKEDSNHKKVNQKTQNGFGVFYSGDENYGEEDDYEELEDYELEEEYQRVKIAKNFLTRGYPVCELKCVVRDLQNKVQWTEKIGKFIVENKVNNKEQSEINIINGNNWCDRLIFHNCIGFELESVKISIMNEKLLEKVHFVENVLGPQINNQIEKYFNNLFKDLPSKVLKPKQIGKMIILNEFLESNGFIISRNKQKKNELLMRYEKISKFSWNLISLNQILRNVKHKLKINHLNKGFTVLNSSSGLLIKKDDPLVNVIKPIIKQKFVLDIEQVLIFIQNILFLLKYENSNNKIFLPWYNKLTKNVFTKQNNFINSLFSEYNTLVKLFGQQKFYSKDRFYRFHTFNIYSLISHYKSYENNNHKNKFGKTIYSSEIRVFVINTTLTYYDQIKINNIFRKKSTHSMNNSDIPININDIDIENFKYLKEYFSPLKNEIEQDEWEGGEFDEDYDVYENYFRNIQSRKTNTGDYVIETPKLIKKSVGIKGNIEFNPNHLVFQNNLSNFGFNIAFINYIYQNSLNLDDSVITSPPWWMVWQSQFYPRISIIDSNKEQDLNLMENPDEFSREMNSTWLELPVNSENPNSFLDLGSFIPKEIISKEILESVILEKIELVNPAGIKKGDLNYSKNKDNMWEIIKEKQQFYISKWKKFDLINDPSNLFFYNLFSKKQTLSANSNFNSTKFYFNPCIINIFSESNNSEWLTNCNAKWKIYSFLFEEFISTINHYLNISTFFDLLNEIKILLVVQSQIG
ncbi:uncharacterized protein cubi_03695 [Cryptosporidium ubiquitum]|uniref:Uncharacterized protein n=1 Tax=Cryptosporidium ubiquitum TaxID=857276 RepID=A0A1J4MF45_9CRYT|nr:uncharacterized protein cubi_03695 [Cryptosporidium ubiquitum]OII72825.1 hypothetical protein cubi_03695 [Cryptosporidium ubiquitum]